MMHSANIIAVAIVTMLITFCECGNLYYRNGGDAGNAEDFWVSTFQLTDAKWFKGSGTQDAQLINDPNGGNQCLNQCIKSPNCNSVNLAELKEGEFYCELTEYHYTDTNLFTVEEKDPGFANWSLKEKRII